MDSKSRNIILERTFLVSVTFALLLTKVTILFNFSLTVLPPMADMYVSNCWRAVLSFVSAIPQRSLISSLGSNLYHSGGKDDLASSVASCTAADSASSPKIPNDSRRTTMFSTISVSFSKDSVSSPYASLINLSKSNIYINS